mgnify:CR=1 FL=1
MKSKDYFYLTLFTVLFSFNLIKQNPIQSLTSHTFSLEDKALSVSVRSLTSEESQTILKHDLINKGYQPIEVTIANQGSHTYEISRASTSLPCATASEIAWKQTRGSIPRGVALKALGFLFWPFSIVSSIDSITTFKKHRHIVRVLDAKGFKDEAETIAPYSLVKRVLYIPQDKVEETFTVALEDVTGDDLVVIPVSLSNEVQSN